MMEHAAADEVTALASEANILIWRTAAGTSALFSSHTKKEIELSFLSPYCRKCLGL